MKLIVLLIVSFAAGLEAVNEYGFGLTSWNYVPGHRGGPSKWGIQNGNCFGQHQSPVNILTSHVKENKRLEFEVHNYNVTGSRFNLGNRNKDIAYTLSGWSPGSRNYIRFNGANYSLFEFNFHWGKENTRGSEHFVDSQRYAGELHIKHYNTKYKSHQEAKDKADGLLYWTFFLKVNSKNNNNTEMQKLINRFYITREGLSGFGITLSKTINVFKLLPAMLDKFFTYKGSLTEPPCYQSVRWIINTDPILLSEIQMTEFRKFRDSKNSNSSMGDNYRPVQSLYNRVVEANFDPTEVYGRTNERPSATIRPSATTGTRHTTKASSGVAIAAPCFLTTITILTAMLFTGIS